MLPRKVFEAGGEADGAGIETFLGEEGHALDVVERRQARRPAHHRPADIAVPDHRGDVDAEIAFPEPIEILGEAAPRHVHARGDVADQLVAGHLVAERRARRAALPHDFERDALMHLAVGRAVDQQREIGMGVDVDETRRDREALGIDPRLRDRAVQCADLRHHAIANADIAGVRRPTRAVDDVAVRDDRVEQTDLPFVHRAAFFTTVGGLGLVTGGHKVCGHHLSY